MQFAMGWECERRIYIYIYTDMFIYNGEIRQLSTVVHKEKIIKEGQLKYVTIPRLVLS